MARERELQLQLHIGTLDVVRWDEYLKTDFLALADWR